MSTLWTISLPLLSLSQLSFGFHHIHSRAGRYWLLPTEHPKFVVLILVLTPTTSAPAGMVTHCSVPGGSCRSLQWDRKHLCHVQSEKICQKVLGGTCQQLQEDIRHFSCLHGTANTPAACSGNGFILHIQWACMGVDARSGAGFTLHM